MSVSQQVIHSYAAVGAEASADKVRVYVDQHNRQKFSLYLHTINSFTYM